MIHVDETFRSLEAALRFKSDYERRYHPARYGTNLRVRKDIHSQEWTVVGHRFASCD